VAPYSLICKLHRSGLWLVACGVWLAQFVRAHGLLVATGRVCIVRKKAEREREKEQQRQAWGWQKWLARITEKVFFFSGPRERFWQKPDVLESFGPRYFSSREYTLTEETMTYGYCERFFLQLCIHHQIHKSKEKKKNNAPCLKSSPSEFPGEMFRSFRQRLRERERALSAVLVDITSWNTKERLSARPGGVCVHVGAVFSRHPFTQTPFFVTMWTGLVGKTQARLPRPLFVSLPLFLPPKNPRKKKRKKDNENGRMCLGRGCCKPASPLLFLKNSFRRGQTTCFAPINTVHFHFGTPLTSDLPPFFSSLTLRPGW
jgi:hypothetical protein